MKTRIPRDIRADLLDMVAGGGYLPVATSGPVSGGEWLALCEAEAEIRENKAGNALDPRLEKAHCKYAGRLRRLAERLRAEGFQPVIFHFQQE